MKDDHQTRLTEAMAELMAERGVGPWALTVAELTRRGGGSAAQARRLLSEPEAALAAAFELGRGRAELAIREAVAGEPRWLDQIRAGVAAALRFLEDEPALGRLVLLYGTAAGGGVARVRSEAFAALVHSIDRGRLEGVAGRRPPPGVIADGAAGGALAIVQNKLLADRSGAGLDSYGALVSVIVAPYLGPAAAARELQRPPPRSPEERAAPTPAVRSGRTRRGPRLTHRTGLVLHAIANSPGASNREVAQRAGIVDQGQVSKLLSRLQGHGLIEKAGARRARGAPNSWTLTASGQAALAGL